MKRLILTGCVALMSLVAAAQSEDPIVMTIAGEDVPRSEFEYNFNKNNTETVIDKKSIDEYVDMFINYKLKVRAAEDAHLDTLSSFKKEFHTYRDQQIRPLLVSDADVEKDVRAYYDGMVKQLGDKDLRQIAHIFLRLPQNATPAQQSAAKARIDSIYAAYKAGASFEKLAAQCSDDKMTGSRGGLIPQWIGPGVLLPEMEKVTYALADSGQVSEPFSSSVGYHLVQLRAKKNLESYEELRPQIQQFKERQGIREQLAAHAVDSLSKAGNMTAEQLMDAETERLCAKDNDLKYLVKEYHDGLLLYELCNTKVWAPAAKDTVGLENYFKTNRQIYSWDKPHYKGIVYYCKDKKDVKVVKKALKKVDESKWIETIRTTFNKDSVMVRMEQKLFEQGDNGYVDSLALKVKHVNAKAKKDYPYVGVVGRVLKNGPEKWTDVSSQVTTDYQNQCDKDFVEELRKRYEVVTYPEVLQTVNRHK